MHRQSALLFYTLPIKLERLPFSFPLPSYLYPLSLISFPVSLSICPSYLAHPTFPPFPLPPAPFLWTRLLLVRLNNSLSFNITTAAGTRLAVVSVLLCLSSGLPILIIIFVLSPVPHVTGITVEKDQLPLLSLIIALFVNVDEIRQVKYSRHELISFDFV